MNLQCYTDNFVIYYNRFVQYKEKQHKTTDSSEIKCFESVPDTSTKDMRQFNKSQLIESKTRRCDMSQNDNSWMAKTYRYTLK